MMNDGQGGSGGKHAVLGWAVAALLALVSASARAANPWTPANLIEPRALAAELSKSNNPVVLQVGFRVLYDGAHIPGARFCGPAEDPAGLARLKDCVAKLSHTQAIVIYCGCCPMDRCPNVRPAFALLRKMGFTRVKVLDLPHDFDTDWMSKGFPVVRPPLAKGAN